MKLLQKEVRNAIKKFFGNEDGYYHFFECQVSSDKNTYHHFETKDGRTILVSQGFKKDVHDFLLCVSLSGEDLWQVRRLVEPFEKQIHSH